jgi:hypothetical protein
MVILPTAIDYRTLGLHTRSGEGGKFLHASKVVYIGSYEL